MQVKCVKCGEWETASKAPRVYRHTAVLLGSPLQVDQAEACAACGREVRVTTSYRFGDAVPPASDGPSGGVTDRTVDRMLARIHLQDSGGMRAFVAYPAVCLSDTR